jgi:hypothetical protein
MGVSSNISVQSTIVSRVWGTRRPGPKPKSCQEVMREQLEQWSVSVVMEVKGFRYTTKDHTLGPGLNECVDCCARTREDLQRDCPYPWRFLERSVNIPRPKRQSAIKYRRRRRRKEG